MCYLGLDARGQAALHVHLYSVCVCHDSIKNATGQIRYTFQSDGPNVPVDRLIDPTYLEAAQHEGLEERVRLAQHVGVHDAVRQVEGAGEDGLAPLVEHVRHEEVQHGPELAEAAGDWLLGR